MFELKRIGFIKRISALLLDVILLAVLTTGFMWIIGLICKFDKQQNLLSEYSENWDNYCKTYFGDIAPYYEYTVTFAEDGAMTLKDKDGNNAFSTDLLNEMIKDKGEKLKDTKYYAAYTAYEENPSAHKYDSQFNYVVSLIFMMLSIGLLLAYIVLEFVIPLFLKNGQTVGKKVFGICLVKENCVKIKPIALFARTLLGKFAIETMFPVALLYMFFNGGGILMLILIAALFILDAVLFFATKNKTPIHDMLAATVEVDAKTQMIYATEDELIAAKTLQDKAEATAPEQAKELKKVETKSLIK